MKLKRITSLLLCGLLTFGGVAESTIAVMAAEQHNSITEANVTEPKKGTSVATAIEGKAIPKVAKSTTAKAAGDVDLNDTTSFPDFIFAYNLYLQFDKNGDGILNLAERNSVTKISMGYARITSFKGVEFFPNLKTFECADTYITSLDLSKNKNLTEIYCANNSNLTKLTLGNTAKLTKLQCSDNMLTSLNLKGSKKLQTLDCDGNQLTSLDLQANKKLTYVNCVDNKLKTLKVPNTLTKLYAQNNQLYGVTGLNNCKKLTTLNLINNLFVKLPSFKSCPKLRYISFEKNYLTKEEILAKLPGSGSNANKKWLSAQLKKQKKLAVPKSLKVATSGKKALAITWKKASNTTGYQVYMSTKKNGTYKKVKTTSALSFTHKKLKKGTTYYYKIRSYRKIGKDTVYSAWTTVKSKKSK